MANKEKIIYTNIALLEAYINSLNLSLEEPKRDWENEARPSWMADILPPTKDDATIVYLSFGDCRKDNAKELAAKLAENIERTTGLKLECYDADTPVFSNVYITPLEPFKNSALSLKLLQLIEQNILRDKNLHAAQAYKSKKNFGGPTL